MATDYNHIATFVRVVEAEGFSAAARALGVPKSSVSRSISRLEETLGTRLLQRTTRKLSLTDAGRAFYERVRESVAGLDEAISTASDTSKEPRGTVRVTAPVDMGSSLLVDVVGRFVRKHPQVRVELALTSRVVDLVGEGFDLAIRAGRLEDSSLIARKLGTSMLGVFASPSYLRRNGRPKTVAELASHEAVLFRVRGGTAKWTLRGPGGDETVEVRGAIAADDFSFVAKAAAAGLGIALLPTFLVPGDETAELARVLPGHTVGEPAAVHVVSPSGRHEPARVTLFREFLVERLKNVHWS